MYDIFISYSRKDTECVQKLTKTLTSAYDSVWFDSPPQPDKQWEKEIEGTLRQCSNLFIVVMQPRDHPLDLEFQIAVDRWLNFLSSKGIPCVRHTEHRANLYPFADDNYPYEDREYLSLLRVLQAGNRETDTQIDTLLLSPPYESFTHFINIPESLSESLDLARNPDFARCDSSTDRPGVNRQSLEWYKQTLLENQDPNTSQQVSFIGNRIRGCRQLLGLSRIELAHELNVEVELLVTVENGCGDLETAHLLLEYVQQLQADLLDGPDSEGDKNVSGLQH